MTDLGAIEKCPNNSGFLLGAYRDGWRDCMRTVFECFENQDFIDWRVEAGRRALGEALKPKS